MAFTVFDFVFSKHISVQVKPHPPGHYISNPFSLSMSKTVMICI